MGRVRRGVLVAVLLAFTACSPTTAPGEASPAVKLVVVPPDTSFFHLLPIGRSVPVGVRLLDAAGVEVGNTAVWTSSDESIATVDSEGRVTGVGRGVSVITATSEALKDSIPLMVGMTGTSVSLRCSPAGTPDDESLGRYVDQPHLVFSAPPPAALELVSDSRENFELCLGAGSFFVNETGAYFRHSELLMTPAGEVYGLTFTTRFTGSAGMGPPSDFEFGEAIGRAEFRFDDDTQLFRTIILEPGSAPGWTDLRFRRRPVATVRVLPYWGLIYRDIVFFVADPVGSGP